MLKDRRSVYRPGTRSRAWWKSKNKITLLVEVLQCAPELVRWGDWGQACVMVFAYREPCPACQQDLWEDGFLLMAGELWPPPVASEAMPRDSG